MRAFAQADRFMTEVQSRKLRPAYVFVGDEVFFRKRCREAILEHLVPSELRDFSLFDFDLSETDLAEILDRARTPSLMAPFQVFFVKGVKTMFGRGSNEDKLSAIDGLHFYSVPALLSYLKDQGGKPATLQIDRSGKLQTVSIQPEVGTVGLTETEARAQFSHVDVYMTTFRPIKATMSGRDTRVLMKLVVDGTTDRVLGCHIVGDTAAEIVQAVAIAVKMKATKADFDATIALHPTASEELVTMRTPTARHVRQAAE